MSLLDSSERWVKLGVIVGGLYLAYKIYLQFTGDDDKGDNFVAAHYVDNVHLPDGTTMNVSKAGIDGFGNFVFQAVVYHLQPNGNATRAPAGTRYSYDDGYVIQQPTGAVRGVWDNP